jgi:hypothetical protein
VLGNIVETLHSKPFIEDTRTAVQGLRRALADVLTSVRANADEPQEVSRRFGLDKTLTWRIARVIRAEDPSEAVAHIPRSPSIHIFLRAMSKHGAPAERVESVLAALSDFERFVHTHSGDRETLEMMLGASPKRSAAKRMEGFRKTGFQANCATWGVRARIQLALHFAAPSAVVGAVDTATVTGLVDFRRLRPDVPWGVASVLAWDAQGVALNGDHPGTFAALDPSVRAGDAPVLREFCTSPTPAMRTIEYPKGTKKFMLCEGPVGNTAAATIMSGWLALGVGSVRESEPGELGEHGVVLSTPVEELIHDLYIHRDLPFAMDPDSRVYNQLPSGPQYPTGGPEAALLPVPTDVADLGGGVASGGEPDTTTPEIPRYREIAELAARRLGWNLGDFHGYRYRLRYPPIPAMQVMRHRLMPK